MVELCPPNIKSINTESIVSFQESQQILHGVIKLSFVVFAFSEENSIVNPKRAVTDPRNGVKSSLTHGNSLGCAPHLQ